MANLLYLVHRMPYPPNKGDKVRSYHLLKHLAARHQVFLGTFIDDPDDAQHLEALRAMCADLQVITLNPRRARLASLGALLGGRALTLDYYDDRRLHHWVRETIAKQGIDAALVFSSSMVQYLKAWPSLPALVDLVDVDSAKWAQYAGEHRWPISWLYRREGERLLAYEREVVDKAAKSFLVTDKEVALFEQLAPEHRGRVQALSNGVDADYFSPDPLRASPYRADELPLVFTGAMDYWPNVDGIAWFVREALPALRQRWPSLRLHIVGHNVWMHIEAVQRANRMFDSGTSPDMLVHPLNSDYDVARLIDQVFAACDRQKSLQIINDNARIWERVIGTRGFTGKRAVNATSMFNNLFETSDTDTSDNDLDQSKLDELEAE